MKRKFNMLRAGFGMIALELFLGFLFIMIFMIDWTLEMIIKVSLIGGTAIFNIVAILFIIIGTYRYYYTDNE